MTMIKTSGLAVVLSTLLTLSPISAMADRDRGGHGDVRWHGDIRVFHVHDFPHWRGGFWHHGVHDGRWGWWWVVGSFWYFYPRVIYPYPDPYIPPTVVIQQYPPAATYTNPPPPQYWYYCESAQAYYPYVPACAEGWKTVPATPQPRQ